NRAHSMRKVVLFLILLGVAAAAKKCDRCLYGSLYDEVCKWHGNAPFCGSTECPEGTTEIARLAKTLQSIVEFGPSCSEGKKTLYCLNDVVNLHPEGNCEAIAPWAHCKYDDGLEIADIVYGDIIWPTFCCDVIVLNVK
ncbi:hypothetical protein PMAYCL1PPCAC_09671, partial [Pristionchus mayeri]